MTERTFLQELSDLSGAAGDLSLSHICFSSIDEGEEVIGEISGELAHLLSFAYRRHSKAEGCRADWLYATNDICDRSPAVMVKGVQGLKARVYVARQQSIVAAGMFWVAVLDALETTADLPELCVRRGPEEELLVCELTRISTDEDYREPSYAFFSLRKVPLA